MGNIFKEFISNLFSGDNIPSKNEEINTYKKDYESYQFEENELEYYYDDNKK